MRLPGPAIVASLVLSFAVGRVHAQPVDRPLVTPVGVPTDPPRFGYTTEPAFGTVRFTDPVAIATPPGETNRIFVAEQGGRLAVIPDLTAPTRRVYLDIASRITGGRPTDERGLLGFAFHPDYTVNGQVFVFYSAMTNGLLHQRLSRFTVSTDDPNQADPASEVMLLSQRDDAGNHNGGDLHFGPDGYLYVSLGDEGGQNDSLNNSQRITRDFFSAILRLDVDQRPGSLPPNSHPAVFPGAYAVPPDNPWVGATTFLGQAVNPEQVRTEFWAIGLRNPWRMSFDPATGRLWVGDVGQNAREEIDVVMAGGNYGWAFREGSRPGPKSSQAPAGFASEAPVAEYSHGRGPMQGNSVTGGVVYRGQRMSQLTGRYVFADYVSGNVWAVPADGAGPQTMERLTGAAGIAGFGWDPRNGDVLLADQSGDRLLRLTYSPVATGTPLPPTLADTGAFLELGMPTPAAGVVPYEINVPFWSDGALKRRWFSVPEASSRLTFRRDDPWSFPAGTVWIKHFELELTNGVPDSRRRLETRFLVRNSGGVHGFTYRWTDPPTNAVLVAEEGLDETFLITQSDGTLRAQSWRYPGRAECLQCHTPAAGWALGFNTRQLNRDIEGGAGLVNQLIALEQAGYLDSAPEAYAPLPALAPADDERVSVDWRVRSWLDANCSQCHQPGGSALGSWDARSQTPLSATQLVNGLLREDFGDPDRRLVVPGSVSLSMLHDRVTRLDDRRMPPLASNVVDDDAEALLRRWILDYLPGWRSYEAWQSAVFADFDPATAMPEVVGPEADPDGDGAKNWLEYLTGTLPLQPGDAWGVSLGWDEGDVVLRYSHLAHRGFVVEWTDTLSAEARWRPLEAEANRFFIAAESFEAEVKQSATASARYYRVRVFEP